MLIPKPGPHLDRQRAGQYDHIQARIDTNLPEPGYLELCPTAAVQLWFVPSPISWGVALTRFWQVSLDGCLLLFLSSCIVSCSVIFVFVFCHFCLCVLLFLRSCSVIFVFVFCYFCVCVLQFLCVCVLLFLRSCSAFCVCVLLFLAFVLCNFWVRVLIFLRLCSVICAFVFHFLQTNVGFVQNKMYSLNKRCRFSGTNVLLCLEQIKVLIQNKCRLFAEQMWNSYRT